MLDSEEDLRYYRDREEIDARGCGKNARRMRRRESFGVLRALKNAVL